MGVQGVGKHCGQKCLYYAPAFLLLDLWPEVEVDTNPIHKGRMRIRPTKPFHVLHVYVLPALVVATVPYLCTCAVEFAIPIIPHLKGCAPPSIHFTLSFLHPSCRSSISSQDSLLAVRRSLSTLFAIGYSP